VAAALALLGVMLAISPHFGSTTDERFQQAYGEKIWSYFAGRVPRADFDTDVGNEYLYGGLVETAAVAAQKLAPAADVYMVRHAVNSVFGWIGIVYAARLAARLFGAPVGWLVALLLALSPRYLADSMNNPKDVPFAAFAMVALYYILTIDRHPPHLSWRHALKLGASIALALNVRPLGLALLGFAGMVVAAHAAWWAASTHGSRRWRDLLSTGGRLAAVAAIAIPLGAAFWPWAHASPFLRPVQAFFVASAASWARNFHVLYAGQDLGAGELPWHYVPAWFAMSQPPVVVLGLALVPVAWRRWPDSRRGLLALAGFAVVPAAAAIVRDATLYDGLRHLFFIVPPLFVLSAAGWWASVESARARARTVMLALLLVGLAEPLVFQIRNHPNQHVYFSPVTGGPRAAFGRYDMDYWGQSMLQAVTWAAGLAERAGMVVVLSGNPAQVVSADAGRYHSVAFVSRASGAYHLDIRLLRGPGDSVREFAARGDVLYRVTTADGTPLCVVLPGPAYGALVARLERTE
jgi:hypothetical protein